MKKTYLQFSVCTIVISVITCNSQTVVSMCIDKHDYII